MRRYLLTEHNSTLVLSIPVDVLEAVRHRAAGVDAADAQSASIHQ